MNKNERPAFLKGKGAAVGAVGTPVRLGLANGAFSVISPSNSTSAA